MATLPVSYTAAAGIHFPLPWEVTAAKHDSIIQSQKSPIRSGSFCAANPIVRSTDATSRREENMLLRIAAIAALMILVAPLASARPLHFSPKTDSRGFIDVWQLRRDVARAESYYYAPPEDRCEPGGPDDTEAQDRAYDRCMKRRDRWAAVRDKVDVAFNRAWLPAILHAKQLGDPIAEVILLSCDTTPVLDRRDIESTCANDTRKTDAAIARLRTIGFMPAIPHDRSLLRGWMPGMGPVQQNESRAFTIDLWYLNDDFDDVSETAEAFLNLRLNRRPMTPGYLTFGSASYYRGGPELWTPTQDVADLRSKYAATFKALDTAIDQWLKRDPRWAVFLLHRVGHYEWVPEGMATATGRLNPTWHGHWRLIAQTPDWNQPLQPAHGRAVIRYRHRGMVISTSAMAALAVLPDVSNCSMRYSGGVTYTVDPNKRQYTALGAYTGKYATQALAELNPNKRYKQVLMQCEGAESDDSNRARFLLEARDYMIEIGALSTDPNHVAVRVYRRVH